MTYMLLQIGEFARLAGLPVRTVRYYGDVGLLPPSSVDPASGYRRYGIDQLERARQLIALKSTGLTLDEIRLVLDDHLTATSFVRCSKQRSSNSRRNRTVWGNSYSGREPNSNRSIGGSNIQWQT